MSSPMYGERHYGAAPNLGPLRPPGTIPETSRQAPKGVISAAQIASYGRLVEELEALRDKHCPPGGDGEPILAPPRKLAAAALGIPPRYRGASLEDFDPREFEGGMPRMSALRESVAISGELGARVSDFAGWIAREFEARWVSVPALCSELAQAGFRPAGERSTIDRLTDPARLVLDELDGVLGHRRAMPFLDDLLKRRNEAGRITVITATANGDAMAEADIAASTRIAFRVSGYQGIRLVRVAP